MENIKRLLQEYEIAKKTAIFSKIENFLDRNITGFFKIFISILILGFVFTGIFFSFKTALINLFFISVFNFVFFGFVLILINTTNTDLFFSKAGKIKRKIYAQKYVGDIYDIFDKNCPITIGFLQKYKDDLSKSIYESKGLKGSQIFFLMTCIKEEREKQKKDAISQEEKEALIAGETKIGNMLKTLEDI